MIKEHDCVALTEDFPEDGLKTGDVGAVVCVHQGGAVYEVEFVTTEGRTVAVSTLLASQVRPVEEPDLASERPRGWANQAGLRGTLILSYPLRVCGPFHLQDRVQPIVSVNRNSFD